MATGKRAAPRRAARPKSSLDPTTLVLALGITACVVAWGYLVYLAIDFGTSARTGQAGAWGMLVLASLGAVACLFAGLMMAARLLRPGGLAPGRAPAEAPAAAAPVAARQPGGRRAAR